MFRTVPVARIAKRAFENAVERKNTITGIQNIIRCSLTEFDKGIQEYRVFRESHDTPDWGVVRMSSIAMSQSRFDEAEVILKEQMEEYGGMKKRQARNVDVSDEQISASIERVLRKDEDAAYRFFEFLKKYKFCANRDVFISVLVSFTVRKHGWKQGFEKLQKVMEGDKRAKNMKMSAYFILEDAVKKGKFQEAESLISNSGIVKPSTLRSLQIFIQLCAETSLPVADYCKRNTIKFAHEDVLFMIEMAGKMKFPMPLLNLLGIHAFVPLPKSSFFPIFDELIKLAGKSGKAENLEEMIRRVKSTRELEDEEKAILYGKLRHFFKCLNVETPKSLYFLTR